jgi:dimethylargininase
MTNGRLLALTRPVSPAFARCELTHLERVPIDVERAERQHAGYEALLEQLGCELVRLPVEPDLPDSVFVEDTAVVVDELAVITRPGAPSRRGETASMAAALVAHRPLAYVSAPAILDGGDVLRVGRRIWVGLSARSDRAAVAQLGALLAPHGYRVDGVDLRDCLHLKTAVTEVDDGVLIVNPEWVDGASFPDCEVVEVHPDEPFAGCCLRVVDPWTNRNAVLIAAAHPRTAERLAARGLDVRTVEVDEMAKAEGGVTCCSVIFRAS